MVGAPAESSPVADAAVSTRSAVVIAILTADCLPVLFSSDDGGVIAAAHAGWRGLAAGILESTVTAMRRPAASLYAWLGPAAGPEAYEIGEEVRSAFVDRSMAAGAHSPRREPALRVICSSLPASASPLRRDTRVRRRPVHDRIPRASTHIAATVERTHGNPDLARPPRR